MANKSKHNPPQLPPIKYSCANDVVNRAKEAIGLSMLQIDKSEGHWRLNPNNKGAVGQILEESWFRYAPNGNPTADFEEFGLELKSFAYLVNRKGEKVAKERLCGNVIDYMEDYKHGFYESSFLKKCRALVLMTYEYKSNPAAVVISGAGRFDLPTDLLQDLEQDYYVIIGKIQRGQAHDIHGGDTEFLEAMTKGDTAEDKRRQPFSSIMAPQRAFALKAKVVTRIIQEVIFAEHLLPRDNPRIEWTDEKFEQELSSRVAPYVGMCRGDLILRLGLQESANAKHINELIFNRMLGVKKASRTFEFMSRHYLPKTIRLNRRGGITDSMVFRPFNFRSVALGEWEKSVFYGEITSRFVFPVFKEEHNGEYRFLGVYFWSMPKADIEEARKVWEMTKRLLNGGLRIWDEGGRTKNNLPSKSDNRVAHVRPHTQLKRNVDILPDGSGRVLTKQSFWLNNTYVVGQLKKIKEDLL